MVFFVMKKLLLLLVAFLFLFNVALAVDVASDGFESNSFSGGYGWSGSWVVGGQQAYTWYFPHSGTFGAFVNGLSSITRETDTTGYSDVNVGFWLRVVSPPHTVSYVLDGVETDLVTVSSVSPYSYYDFDLPAGVTSLKFNNDDYSSQSYVDDVLISGELGVVPEVSFLMSDNYVVGGDANVVFSSTESSSLHSFALSYPNGSVFCDKSLLSPSVAQTSFSTSCGLPSEQVIDAKAFFYLSNDVSVNFTDYFNVVALDNDPSVLGINQVYFSRQVLQGGSTEVFALVDTDLVVDDVFLELVFPDGSERIIPMYLTVNGEYRAFITDTYSVGDVSFKIVVRSATHFAEYVNEYEVVAYNVDFVETVDFVNRILEPKMSVFGTEYSTGENGTVFLQLLDGFGNVVNDGSCHLSIFYPDKSLWYDDVTMDFASNGLYYEDFVTPDIYGIYMTSVYCMYDDFGARFDAPSSDVLLSAGGTFDKETTGSPAEVEYSDCLMAKGKDTFYNEFRYDEPAIGNINASLLSSIDLTWIGQNEKDNCFLQAYDFVSASWVSMGASFDKSDGADGNCEKSKGVNRDVTSDFSRYISGDEFRWRVFCGDDDKKIFTDNVELIFHNSGGFINNIRGSNEIHISPSTDGILGELASIKNDTESILNNTVQIISLSSVFNISLEELIIDLSNLSVEIPSVMIGGTEYVAGQEGLVAVRLAKTVGSSQQLITGASCSADILYPNQSVFVSGAGMVEYGGGIYHYNFTVPSVEGVYIYSVDCSDGGKDYYSMNTFHVSPSLNLSRYELGFINPSFYFPNSTQVVGVRLSNVLDSGLFISNASCVNSLYSYDGVGGLVSEYENQAMVGRGNGDYYYVAGIPNSSLSTGVYLVNSTCSVAGVDYVVVGGFVVATDYAGDFDSLSSVLIDGLNVTLSDINYNTDELLSLVSALNITLTGTYSNTQLILSTLDELNDTLFIIIDRVDGLNDSLSDLYALLNSHDANLSSLVSSLNNTLTIIGGDVAGLGADLSVLNSTLNSVDLNTADLQSNISNLYFLVDSGFVELNSSVSSVYDLLVSSNASLSLQVSELYDFVNYTSTELGSELYAVNASLADLLGVGFSDLTALLNGVNVSLSGLISSNSADLESLLSSVNVSLSSLVISEAGALSVQIDGLNTSLSNVFIDNFDDLTVLVEGVNVSLSSLVISEAGVLSVQIDGLNTSLAGVILGESSDIQLLINDSYTNLTALFVDNFDDLTVLINGVNTTLYDLIENNTDSLSLEIQGYYYNLTQLLNASGKNLTDLLLSVNNSLYDVVVDSAGDITSFLSIMNVSVSNLIQSNSDNLEGLFLSMNVSLSDLIVDNFGDVNSFLASMNVSLYDVVESSTGDIDSFLSLMNVSLSNLIVSNGDSLESLLLEVDVNLTSLINNNTFLIEDYLESVNVSLATLIESNADDIIVELDGLNTSLSSVIYSESAVLGDLVVSVNSSLSYLLGLLNDSVSGIEAEVSVLANITEIPVLLIGGTEYVVGDEGLLATRLVVVKNNKQELVTGASCSASVLYPNASLFFNNVSMVEYGDGVYYTNFTVPSVSGVYIYTVDCVGVGSRTFFGLNTFHVSNEEVSRYLSSGYDYYRPSRGNELTGNIVGFARDLFATDFFILYLLLFLVVVISLVSLVVVLRRRDNRKGYRG